MLILVGVTVNVALNGGLFETANKAVKQTQKEADREILQAAVIAALNEQLKIANAQAIKNNLPDGWEVTGAEGGPYTCTSPKENVFIVYENGEITEPWVDNGNGTFTKGDTTVEIGKTYTNAEFEELLKKLGIIEEYTGDYKGDWQVLGLEGGILKLVSTENVSDNVTLGYADENVYKTNAEGNPILDGEGNKILKDEIKDLNGDGKLEFEKAVWSYRHAVDTLDEVAQKATGITLETTGGKTEARSVNPGDIGVLMVPRGREYTYDYTNHRDQVFVTENGEIVRLDSDGKEVTLVSTSGSKDLSAEKIGTLASGNFWVALATRDCTEYSVTYFVQSVHDGSYGRRVLFDSKGRTSGNVMKDGLRAVVLF